MARVAVAALIERPQVFENSRSVVLYRHYKNQTDALPGKFQLDSAGQPNYGCMQGRKVKLGIAA